MSCFDVIGDVHGHGHRLTALLRQLGYAKTHGAWRHPECTAVFIGDLIDRGPLQLETLELVRAMVDAGTARIVLGNHEFNAVAWTTFDPVRGDYCRSHNDKHRGQHEAFLREVVEGSAAHRDWVAWFTTIPLWLDLGGLRVVHACWDPNSMEVVGPLLDAAGGVSDELVIQGTDKSTKPPAYWAIESLLKGPEIALPEGYAYLDKDGNVRHRARYTWWRADATTMRTGAEIPRGATLPSGEPFPDLPDEPFADAVPAPYVDEVPVIFGHYWKTGRPTVISPKLACVDYSAGKGGPLVAYRWCGEADLDEAHLRSV